MHYELDLLNNELREQLINISDFLDLMDRLVNDSRRIEPFVKSLTLFELGHLLYVLYPFTFVFNSIIELEIDTCTIPLIALLRIGESLKKLKKLTLKAVLAIEFEKQELTSSLDYLPSSLEELNLELFYIVTLNPRSSDIYIARNQHYKEYTKLYCFIQSKPSSLKNLYFTSVDIDNILILLNLKPSIEEIKVMDFDLDQKLFDKFSTLKNLKKLSIHITDTESSVITSYSGLIFPQFNFITELSLDLIECLYKPNNEFLYFTNHFPNLTWLTINLNLNFANIDIGRFFLETLPSYKKLKILTLVYVDYDKECNFNWLGSINVECLVLHLYFFDPYEINFNLFSYKIKEIRKSIQFIKFELKYIENNPKLHDKWTITHDEEFIYLINKDKNF